EGAALLRRTCSEQLRIATRIPWKARSFGEVCFDGARAGPQWVVSETCVVLGEVPEHHAQGTERRLVCAKLYHPIVAVERHLGPRKRRPARTAIEARWDSS